MNRSTGTGALAALLLVAGAAPAAVPDARETGAYWGINVGQVDYAESGLPHFNPTAVMASLGWDFNRYLAVEGRLGTGIAGDTGTVFGVPVDLKVKSFYGGYLRGTVPLGNVFSVYALAGYGHGELEASAMGLSVSTSDGSFSGAVGGEFAIGKSGAIGVEYGRMVSGSGYDANMLSIGYRMRL